MLKKLLLCSCLAGSLLAKSELETLKEQLRQQQEQTKRLAHKIEEIEAKERQNEDAEIDALMANDTTDSFAQNAYLPDIALILNMSAVARDANNSAYENFAIPGFIGVGEAKLPFNKNRGFNFNYAEVAMHANVDPYFEAFAFFHIHPDEFEIEEAFVDTTSLPYGFKIKAGKFRSAFGRQNEKHHHIWWFDEQPIIYKALFGPDGINDPGLQLQWVAPTDTYVMAGVEAMQGTNDRSFGYGEVNLYNAYLKTSIDIGDTLSLLGGVSLAHGKTQTNYPSDIYGADLTLRDQLGGYSALIWQSEYLHRNKKTDAQTDKQAGLYTELIYQYDNNFAGGVRYDRITKNDTDLSAYTAKTDNLERYSAMFQYKPFEFSRLRLEYSLDRTKIIDGVRKDINTLMLTLNIAAGAHGAHGY